ARSGEAPTGAAGASGPARSGEAPTGAAGARGVDDAVAHALEVLGRAAADDLLEGSMELHVAAEADVERGSQHVVVRPVAVRADEALDSVVVPVLDEADTEALGEHSGEPLAA